MWELSVQLMGSNGKKSTVNYQLQATEYAAAVTARTNLLSALDAVTDAAIASTRLSEVEAGTLTLPDGADVFEAASISVHLKPVTELQKLATINIPAPVIGIFQGVGGIERDLVDKDNSTLQQYVDAIEAEAYISDGEKPDATHGSSGIYAGRRIVRKQRLGV